LPPCRFVGLASIVSLVQSTTMQFTLATLAAFTAASIVSAQTLKPTSGPPAGCSSDFASPFEISVSLPSKKRDIEEVSLEILDQIDGNETDMRVASNLLQHKWSSRCYPSIPIRRSSIPSWYYLQRWVVCLQQWLSCSWWLGYLLPMSLGQLLQPVQHSCRCFVPANRYHSHPLLHRR
jgi:hypothetical protein